MFLGMYEDNKNELELMKNALSIMESKYNDKCYDYANLLKSNKNLIQDIKNAENYSTEQSIKITCLEIELKDKNDIIKNQKNDINIKLNNYSLNLENRINSLANENIMYKNKISNLESKIDSNVNFVDNLKNKIKFYEDQEKYLVENNNISNNKINELKLQVANLEKESDKLKMYSQNCICLSDISHENILKKEMNELRERLSTETSNKIKIINDAQILLNSKYTWNNDKHIFEENDYEILE